jgi:hypothetical protein
MTRKEIDNIFENAEPRALKETFGFQSIGVSKFQAFLAIKPILTEKLYWYDFRRGYTETDDLYQFRFDIKESLEKYKGSRFKIMNWKEKRHFEKLGETLTIYRAMTVKEKKSKDYGISWTLKREVALSLAEKAIHLNPTTKKMKTIVHSIKITKSDAIAFINQRKEYEIIYVKN